ncbi:MAG TPA: vitamin K epoxide reductase family protein [Flavisolibacter sp.]|nr:vitamin K epoxide reductase family protein [Flavisolibacter sp.]
MRVKALLEKRSTSNVSEATVQLLKSLNVPVTATTAIDQVESHPDFPSLYSISDSLQHWKVENAAFQVEPENLEKLPTPFIAHIRKSGGTFVLVNNINTTVNLINEKGKEQKISRESFLRDWTNTVLLAEKSEHSGEKDFRRQKKKELLAGLRIPVLIAAGLLLAIFFMSLNAGTTLGLAASLLLFVKLIGCIVTGLLLWFEVDKSNAVLQQICSVNRNTNCTALLNSKGAKLFNWLSWSELGFFYFAGSFLFLLQTASYQLPSISILSWLNLLALPFTLFSVYYQWRIAKQWCPLCLVVQASLLTEFAIAYFSYWTVSDVALNFLQNPLSINQLLPVLVAFSLPVLFWVAAKKAFLAAHAGKQFKKELNKLKFNKEIFTALQQKQKAITHSTEGLGITLGNPDATHTLIKVCNPYCGPCAEAHKIIEELINNEDVKVQIIFKVTNNQGDIKGPPVRHLMAISKKTNYSIRQALDAWYNGTKDIDVFKLKYVIDDMHLREQDKTLEAMDKWCREMDISFTPTVFVDGYQLPEIYKIEDLSHLI